MARKKTIDTEVDGQQDLIDVETPEGKAAMKLGRAYRRLKETHAGERRRFKDKEDTAANKFRIAIAELGIKPNADGSFRFQLDGYLVTIPAVKNPPINMKPLREVDESEDEDEDTEDAE
jgi:hypothetical protein